MGLGSKLKKAFKKYVVKPIKSAADSFVDGITTAGKVLLSPFTGAFSIPDINIDTNISSQDIKAKTTVDFNGANRPIPVVYGNNVEIATTPVFADTWGTDSSDTSRQYLYMACVIGQGFGCTASDQVASIGTSPSGAFGGSRISRMLINGQSVHLNTGSNYPTANSAYGYTIPTPSSSYSNTLRANGKGGVQPTQFTINKGTFANRLKIQYFDGSSDQPASSLLSEHPAWGNDNTLSGMQYLAMRFELKAADEVIGGTDGDGTFGNPYSGLPAVVVTVSGRNTPQLALPSSKEPGYRFDYGDTVGATGQTRDGMTFYHQHLGRVTHDSVGYYWQTTTTSIYMSEGYNVFNIPSGKIHFRKGSYGQNLYDGFNNEADSIDVAQKIVDLGMTSAYVYFNLGNISATGTTITINKSNTSSTGDFYDGDSLKLIFKRTASGQYRLLTKCPSDYTVTFTSDSGRIHLLGFNPSVSEDVFFRTSFVLTAGVGVTPAGYTNPYMILGNSTNLASMKTNLVTVADHFGYLDFIDRENNTKIRNLITKFDHTADNEYAIVDLEQEDSASNVLIENQNSTNLQNFEHLEIQLSLYYNASATGNNAADWDIAFASGYNSEGLSHQGYHCNTNPVSHLLDYLLNPNYGAGLSLSDLDRNSFTQAYICCERLREYLASYSYSHILQGVDPSQQDIITANNFITDWCAYLYGPSVDTTAYTNTAMFIGAATEFKNNGYDRQFVIDTGRTHQENINLILSSFGGYMPYINGKYYLYVETGGDAEDVQNLSYDRNLDAQAVLTENNLIDAVSLGVSSLNDKFNTVKVDYTDLAANSQPNSKIVPDPVEDSVVIRDTYLAEDNQKSLEGQFNLTGVFESSTAKRFGNLLLKKSRGQPKMTVQTTAIGFTLVPGDLVRVTLSTMPIDDIYRVTDATLNYDNTVVLALVKHDQRIYTLDDNDYITRDNLFNA